MSWRKSQAFCEKLKEAVNKNDTIAVERIMQEFVASGNDYSKRHRMWVELCEAALKNRCLPMVKLLLPREIISNDFVDVFTNKQLMEAAIESDFIEGVEFLHVSGMSLYFLLSRNRCWSALAKCVEINKFEVLKYLLELKDLDKNPHEEETLLMACCDQLNIESLKILLKSELINTIDRQSRDLQYSALHHCFRASKCCVDGRTPERILACVKLLVETGADINLRDNNGTTPIQMAAECGLMTTVIYLAQRGANLEMGNKQGTLLHFLAESDQMSDSYDECIQLLITKGMDINKPNPLNETPLYLAVRQGNEEMVKSLIKSHCNVNINVGDEMEPLLLASIKLQKTSIVEILIKAGCDVNSTDKNGVTPLMESAKTVNRVVIKELIDHGASVNAKDNERCSVLNYLFPAYHRSNDQSTSADIVKMMIDAGADIHKCSNLLCRAINREDYKTASLLIEHGIDVNTVDANGDNPLALASENGKLELVALLISKDCDINHQNLKGQTALHKTLQKSRYVALFKALHYAKLIEVINTLLIQKGMNPNLSDIDGQTALSMAVRNRERSITETLLKAGADVNHCDDTGQTPLMTAVYQNDTIMENILLNAGADLKVRDGAGRNALFYAIPFKGSFFNDSPVLDTLLKFANLRGEAESIGNVTDENGKTPLMVAAERGPKAMVEELLRAGCNINLQDHCGKMALMFAVDNQDETILSLLLQNGADYNLCDNNGKTALMVAVEKRKEKHCEEMFKSGVSVNQVDQSGKTPLAIAVQGHNQDIVKFLLKAGADVNLSDYYEITPLMEAIRRSNTAMLECLLNADADVNKTDIDGRSAIQYIIDNASDFNRRWINCLKLLLINKCHATLDTPGDDGRTLFQWLLEKPEAEAYFIWYLITENCSLKGLDLRWINSRLQFPDKLMTSKILFESGASKSEIETDIFGLVLNTGLSRTANNPKLDVVEDKKQMDDFRDFCKSRSLKSRCRREIRNCIGPGISSKITQVGLPKYLQDYVVMKDLIPEKYFTLVINRIDDYDHYWKHAEMYNEIYDYDEDPYEPDCYNDYFYDPKDPYNDRFFP